MSAPVTLQEAMEQFEAALRTLHEVAQRSLETFVPELTPVQAIFLETTHNVYFGAKAYYFPQPKAPHGNDL